MIKKYTQHIPIAWRHVREARKLVQEALADHEVSVRDAAAMTMSELLENAMKHGASVSGMTGASFTLTVSDDALCIEVSNGVDSEESLAVLKSRIDTMAKVFNKEALYTDRLQYILDNPTDAGRLGLYRIGCEGCFDLSCSYEAPIVTVTARRALP